MRTLIVEDEKKLGILLCRALSMEGMECRAVESAEAALMLLPGGFDLVITDMHMPGLTGIDLLKTVKSDYPDTFVILMTAYGSVKNAVEAMKAGAYDYLLKPFPADELVLLAKRVEKEISMRNEIEYRRSVEKRKFANIIGNSPEMKKVFSLVEKVAVTEATVLVLGETGTGKELIARAIHNASSRAENAFVAINCAAITETLLESELFGYEKGAFTGADKRKPGMFELARFGTLFLDEIGEMPMSLQAKLLRVLQEKTVFHLGGTAPISVDVRIIAATNRNLRAMVDEKQFREDLYFRLAVFPIEIPPLRARRMDIPLLSEFFLKRRSTKTAISADALEILATYDYPGNVRELQNILERALILSGGAEITPEHIPDLELPKFETDTIVTGESTLDELERKMLIAALDKANGNKSKAAALLGITRRMIYTRLKKHQLS